MQKPIISSFNFSESPFIVIWEMTRSCALRCVHCRAEAIDARDAGELSTEEAYDLLCEIRRFGNPTTHLLRSESDRPRTRPNEWWGKPLVVLTGGDPMRRPDALDIVKFGRGLGFRMAMTPSGTAEMTFEKVKNLKQSGLARLAVSLDGSTAEIHDSFRQVKGSYGWTMDIIDWANAVDLPVQINTTISRHNIRDIDALCALMESLKIVLWSVFFLVPVGRARLEDEITAADYERVFHKMYELSRRSPFDIKSTEAPHYRRVVIQRKMRAQRLIGDPDSSGSLSPRWDFSEDKIGRSVVGVTPPPVYYDRDRDRPIFMGQTGGGVNDGNGFVFISHTGEIFPSGFLPLSAGDVHKDSLVDVYRHSELFQTLRDASRLKGKCGACEYKSICGGSRSRAYAVTGDYLAADPFCVYVPKGYAAQTLEKNILSNSQ